MPERPARLTRAAFRHFRAIPTRWSDNDVYRHVNNVAYYAYFDTLVTGHLIEAGLLDVARSPAIGLVVETGCSFFESLTFPETVEGALAVTRIGRSSVRYAVGIFKRDAELTAAQGYFVHVYVARDSQQPVAVPAEIRAALALLKP